MGHIAAWPNLEEPWPSLVAQHLSHAKGPVTALLCALDLDRECEDRLGVSGRLLRRNRFCACLLTVDETKMTYAFVLDAASPFDADAGAEARPRPGLDPAHATTRLPYRVFQTHPDVCNINARRRLAAAEAAAATGQGALALAAMRSKGELVEQLGELGALHEWELDQVERDAGLCGPMVLVPGHGQVPLTVVRPFFGGAGRREPGLPDPAEPRAPRRSVRELLDNWVAALEEDGSLPADDDTGQRHRAYDQAWAEASCVHPGSGQSFLATVCQTRASLGTSGGGAGAEGDGKDWGGGREKGGGRGGEGKEAEARRAAPMTGQQGVDQLGRGGGSPPPACRTCWTCAPTTLAWWTSRTGPDESPCTTPAPTATRASRRPCWRA